MIEFICKVKAQTKGKWNWLKNSHLTFQGHLDSSKVNLGSRLTLLQKI